MKKKRQTLKEYKEQREKELYEKLKKDFLTRSFLHEVKVCFKYNEDESVCTAIYLKDIVTGETFPECIEQEQ